MTTQLCILSTGTLALTPVRPVVEVRERYETILRETARTIILGGGVFRKDQLLVPRTVMQPRLISWSVYARPEDRDQAFRILTEHVGQQIEAQLVEAEQRLQSLRDLQAAYAAGPVLKPGSVW